MRVIHAPNDELKNIQIKLTEFLYSEQNRLLSERGISPNISHGFEKGKNIISNARIHRNKRYVLNIDLKNFFDSFHFGRVRGYFHKNKHFNYPIEVATVIAQLVCYKGSLPQGAPTSPVITNLICQILDFRILSLAKKYRMDYTRYADDLTFSTNNRDFLSLYEDFMNEITAIIEKAGFYINEKKIRLQYRNSKQTTTGLVVNKRISVEREYVRKTKAMAHSLYRTGTFTIDGKEGSLQQLEGRFAFINQLDEYENKNISLPMRNQYTLNGREKQYQKFLFYKHFFSPDKPVIVTEGKTDPLYLKAALRKYYTRYPHLIERLSDETYQYKVVFFKRTRKMSYFFGVVEHGADTLNNIYKYYKGGSTNYFVLFKKHGTISKNPLMFIFDNELNSKDKPIKKFWGYTNLSDADKEHFKTEQVIQLIKESNLYLITNPLVQGKPECEIEDLFSQEVLDTEIDGKKFDRKVEKGDSKHYGKVVFARFVYDNYEKIDFPQFLPMLDNINRVVESYM